MPNKGTCYGKGGNRVYPSISKRLHNQTRALARNIIYVYVELFFRLLMGFRLELAG